MVEETSKISVWVSRLTHELKRDKKRTAILVTLLAVGGAVGARFALTRQVPKRADAVAPGDAGGANRKPASGGEDGRAGLGGQPGQAQREQYVAQMDRTITRKLFTPVLALYPPAERGPAGAHDGQAGGGWFGRAYEWIKRKRQVHADRLSQIAAVRTQAEALSLQTTMLGSSPTALVNDRVLHIGESINGFCVKRIVAGSCVLTKNGVKVELRMKE